jgi:hypothetical protein
MAKRFYIPWSSIFNSPPYYQLDLIRAALKEAGAKNVRACQQFGWSNQPRVATYSARDRLHASRLASHVEFVLNKHVFVREKDWR